MELLYGSVERGAAPVLRHWFDWDLRGTERLADGPLIVAANHVSYLDPFVVAYALHGVGRRGRFLAKAELFRNPVLGALLRRLGQIAVERGKGDMGSLQRAEEALWRGQTVVVFPEATIGPGLPLLPLKTGTARLALATGVPVVPLAVWGGQQAFPKGGRRRLRRGVRLTVVAGEPLAPPVVGGDREHVANLTAVLRERLSELVTSASGVPDPGGPAPSDHR